LTLADTSTTRLSASRVLRARKIMLFIYEKLELGPPSRTRQGSMSTTARISALGQRRPSGQPQAADPEPANPEEMIELVIGETVVDPRITLATLKQYYGSGGDMLLNYRLKKN
jgi:WD repeat-containing protein 48